MKPVVNHLSKSFHLLGLSILVLLTACGGGGGGGGGGDKTAPVVALSYPVGGEILSGMLLVTWSTDDQNTSNVKISISRDGGNVFEILENATPDTGSYSIDTANNLLFANDGNLFQIQLQASDIPGNTSNIVTSNNFAIDNTAPVVKLPLNLPTEDQHVSGNKVLSWTTEDDNPLAVELRLSNNGGSSFDTELSLKESSNGNYNWQTADFPDGSQYVIQVRAKDSAGNISDPVNFPAQYIIDNTVPIITLNNQFGPGDIIQSTEITWSTAEVNRSTVEIRLSTSPADDFTNIIITSA